MYIYTHNTLEISRCYFSMECWLSTVYQHTNAYYTKNCNKSFLISFTFNFFLYHRKTKRKGGKPKYELSLLLVPMVLDKQIDCQPQVVFQNFVLGDHKPLSITAPDRGLAFSVLPTDSVFFKNNKANLPWFNMEATLRRKKLNAKLSSDTVHTSLKIVLPSDIT